MTKVILGSNDFFGVPLPLVVADQFFHIYSGPDGRMRLDIFRWDEVTKTATYEVKGNVPLEDGIRSSPTGTITFTEEQGGFLFKFRPKPGVSQVFGKVPGPSELVVHINDTEVRVERGSIPVVTLQQNQFSGLPIGIEVGADGSIGIGVNRLPEGMELTRSPA